jgi:ubiquinone/menaquinone biosynthesis C-methylase UbiE
VPRPVSRPTRCVSVEQGYELWAPTYDRDPNPALALEERQLKPLLPSLKGKDVLDVACGTGRWLDKLLNLGARSGVGVDFSAAMLAAAGTKTTLHGRLVRADCLSLPVRARRADLLICSFLLAHLGDLAAFAVEVWRVAKPGANVFVTDLHPEAYAQGWQTSFRDESGTVEISTFARPLRQVVEVFTLHGFELQQCIEANVDEPERRIFVEAGRTRSFEEACHVRAIFICHFRRPVS